MAVNSVNLEGLNRLNPINFETAQVNESETGKVSFADYLKEAIDNVKTLQDEAKTATEKLVTGEIQDIHSVMIAVEKAELALQFTLAIRNKILDAYNEIMRMPI